MWDRIRSNVTSEVTEGHRRSLFEFVSDKAEIWHEVGLPHCEGHVIGHFDLRGHRRSQEVTL